MLNVLVKENDKIKDMAIKVNLDSVGLIIHIVTNHSNKYEYVTFVQ